MPSQIVPNSLQTAMQLHSSGNLRQAEIIYRQIINNNPRNPDAHHLLGLIAYQAKKYDPALACFSRAIKLNPSVSVYYLNRGNAYRAQGEFNTALESYQKALTLQPDYPDAHYNCGIISQQLGNLDYAVKHYEKAIALNPDHAHAYNNLGNALREQGNIDAALHNYQKAVRIKPDYAHAYNNIGNILKSRDKQKEAFYHYKKALRLSPGYADAHYNIGIILQERCQTSAAVKHFREAIRLKPDYDKAHLNLGIALQQSGRIREAVKHYKSAIGFKPDLDEAYNNLGVAFKELGKLEEAYECFNKALEIKPDFSEAHSNLLLNLHYHSSLDRDCIFSEHKRWAKKHAAAFESSQKQHDNSPDPDRRLRIGYVSPDFHLHSVSFFVEPVLANHDHSSFEIFCYANVKKQDYVTERLRGLADHWCDILGTSHEEVEALVRKHRIDILIDLAGHTANNRMMLFARKPAPVQVSWLGYPDTTGLSTMDYRFTDSHADPEGQSDNFSTEKLVRIPSCFLCYNPPENSPDVEILPALKNGYITFGSFNNLNKVTPLVVDLWARILKSVPGSRLILKSGQLSDRYNRDRFIKMFSENGISSDRIELMSEIPSLTDHLALYNRIDIALDPFPYNGTTTTCETLWMGVPVIVLEGDRHSSRVGSSLLSAIGRPDWITPTHDAYVSRAVSLSADVEQLKDCRAGLREAVLKSPLTDAKKFTAYIEKSYRQIWKKWCRSHALSSVVHSHAVSHDKELSTRKLHIGGSSAHQGWEVFNIINAPHVDHVGNAKDLSRFPDETFSDIYASHVIEHFDYTDELPGVLKELHRVLMPRGKLYISVPDMDKLCRLFLMKDKLSARERFNVMRMMFGGHVDKYDYHNAGLNHEFLEEFLLKAGFENVKVVDAFNFFQDTSTLHVQGYPISLNIISEKPDAFSRVSKTIRTGAKEIEVFDDDIFLVSYPRSGNTWLRFLLASALHNVTCLNFNSIEGFAPDLYRHENDFLVSAKRPRIIKSHEMYCSDYPRTVYLYRDVRDVIVSFFHYLAKQDSCLEFEEYFNLFISGKLFQKLKLGSWDENIKSWLEHRDRIIAIRYEDMLDNPESTLIGILNHLGVEYDRSLIKRAIKKYSFQGMTWMEQSAEEVDYLSNNRKNMFVRHGKKGQWKPVFNKQQLEKIKEKYGSLLIKLGYETNSNWQ